ncbi:hypothetical protein SteCoe_18404 [Stentor coeruleus]|uniref:F-box domain-containing protein n=1 Tax=Stentor coeruleus TaxID=5963 RepID=A0A1R2BWJ1_9CILI|nr:hypothetical protein SteCoe_18404 [Stentor coeruleus]
MNNLRIDLQSTIFTYLPLEEVFKNIACISKNLYRASNQYLAYSKKLNAKLKYLSLKNIKFNNLLSINLFVYETDGIEIINLNAPNLKKLKLNFMINLPNIQSLMLMINFEMITQLTHLTIGYYNYKQNNFDYGKWIRYIKSVCPNFKKFKLYAKEIKEIFVSLIDGIKYISDSYNSDASIRKCYRNALIKTDLTGFESATKVCIKESENCNPYFNLPYTSTIHIDLSTLPKTIKSLTILGFRPSNSNSLSFHDFKDFPRFKSLNGIFISNKNYIKYTQSKISVIKSFLTDKFRIQKPNINFIKHKVSNKNIYSSIYDLALKCLISNPRSVKIISGPLPYYKNTFDIYELAYFILRLKDEFGILNEKEKLLLFTGMHYLSSTTNVNLNEIILAKNVLKNAIEGKAEINISNGRIDNTFSNINLKYCTKLKILNADFYDDGLTHFMHSIKKNLNLINFEIQSSTIISNADYFSFLKFIFKKKSIKNISIQLTTTRINFNNDFDLILEIIEKFLEDTLMSLECFSIDIPVDMNDKQALFKINELLSKINIRALCLSHVMIFFEKTTVICEYYKTIQDT